MHIKLIDVWQGCQEYPKGKGEHLQQTLLGKLDIHMQKNEIRPLPYTMHKTQLKLN